MPLKWKPISIGHAPQPDTVHTATFAVVSEHVNVFGSLLRSASDYMTSIVTTDPVQIDAFCAAVVIPVTILLLRGITRDLKPANNISLRDKITIQKQMESAIFTTPEQQKRIGDQATKLGININAYIKETLGMEAPRSLKELTKREGEIVEVMINKMTHVNSSSIREVNQIV